MGLPSNVKLIRGDGVDLLITIVLVFSMFITMSYGFPASLHASNNVCRSFGQKHKRAASSAHLKLLKLMPFAVTQVKSSTSLNIYSVYNSNRLGDNTHPCRTPLLSQSQVIPPTPYKQLFFHPNTI